METTHKDHCGTSKTGPCGHHGSSCLVSDNVDMMATREAKIRKYSDNRAIDAAIKSKPGVVKVRHCPLIITNRGIWCQKSAMVLIRLGILSRKDILLMPVRVIEGSLKDFHARDFHQPMGSSVCKKVQRKRIEKIRMKTGCRAATRGHYC